MIKDKRGLQFKSSLVAIVILSMSIIAIGFWVNDWNTAYNSGLTYDLDEYNKLQEISEYADTSKGNISTRSSFDTTANIGDFEGTSLRGAFGIINNIFSAFDVVLGEGGLIDSIEERWGIPDYIIIGIITIIVLYVLFAIIAIFFRRSTTST